MKDCVFCTKIPKIKTDPTLIHEFKNSYLLVGDHQTYPGYSVLVLKEHVKELFDLDPKIQTEFNNELMIAAKAIKEAYSAEKINVSNYGNMTPHLHWHIFPRQKTDSNWPQPPWSLMDKFNESKTTPEMIKNVLTQLQPLLK